MSIDVESEVLVPFASAGGAFPGNRTPSQATLHRWRLKGVRGVRLETILIGGLRYTSKEAISRFIASQNASETQVPVLTPKQRRAQSEAAREALRKSGI